MKPASGGATTTNTARDERARGFGWSNRDGRSHGHGFRACIRSVLLPGLGTTVRRERGGDNRLEQVHVDDGRHAYRRDANAGRLDNVDGVDAHAGTDVARRRRVSMLRRYRQAVYRQGVDPQAVAGAVCTPIALRSQAGQSA